MATGPLENISTIPSIGKMSPRVPDGASGTFGYLRERAISSMWSAEIGNQSTKCVNIFSAHVQMNHSFTHFDNCVTL